MKPKVLLTISHNTTNDLEEFSINLLESYNNFISDFNFEPGNVNDKRKSTLKLVCDKDFSGEIILRAITLAGSNITVDNIK